MDDLPSLASFGIQVKEVPIEVPEKFTSTYKDDFNILSAHRFVLAGLEEKKKKIPIYNQRIEKLELELQKRQSLVQRADRISKIEKLRFKISRLQNIKENYLAETKDLLAKYEEMGTIEVVRSFSNKAANVVKESEEHREARHRIILLYVEKTSKYYKINAVLEGEEIRCLGCGAEFPHEIADEFSPPACLECGVVRKRMAKVPFSTENIKDNINRNDYEGRGNFIKAMELYQGKQVIKNTKTLFKDLDDYFTSYGMKNGDQVRSLPLNDKGKKAGTNKSIMFKALKEKGYSSYYKNINLICNLYWGWSLPDISDLEDKLLADYDAFQSVYEKIKTGRRSSLNVDYMLLILLLKQGYPCSSEDFKIVKTDEIFDEYQETCAIIFQELGWKPITIT